MNDGIKVKEVKKKDAYDARAEKDPNILPANTHMLGRKYQSNDHEYRRGKKQTNEADLHRGKPRSGKPTNKQADNTPQNAREEDRQNR